MGGLRGSRYRVGVRDGFGFVALRGCHMLGSSWIVQICTDAHGHHVSHSIVIRCD